MNDQDGLYFEHIDCSERFFELEPEWRRLFSQIEAPSISSSWEWQSSWWRIFGTAPAHRRTLRIAAWRQGSELVALLPLYRERTPAGGTCLRFLSCSPPNIPGVYPEYLDMLCLPQWVPVLADRVHRMLGAPHVYPWHVLMLERFGEDSTIAAITRQLRGARYLTRCSTMPSPRADLRGGFDAYLRKRSTNTRSRFRRLLRAYEEQQMQFQIAETPEEAAAFLEQLMRLHQERWTREGATGAFAAPQVRAFHHALLRVLMPARNVILARLSDADGPLAVLYGFVYRQKFDFYQSGVRLGDLRSPGIMAHLLTMRTLAQRGIVTYDFLGGEADYKSRLATGQGTLCSMSLYRPSLGAAWEAGRGLVQRAWMSAARPPAAEPESA